jgi:hypothetical protein
LHGFDSLEAFPRPGRAGESNFLVTFSDHTKTALKQKNLTNHNSSSEYNTEYLVLEE